MYKEGTIWNGVVISRDGPWNGVVNRVRFDVITLKGRVEGFKGYFQQQILTLNDNMIT